MQVYITVCITLLMVALGVLTVYFVQTLIQFKKTARSVESLSDNLNEEVAKLKGVTDSTTHWMNALSGSMGKTTVAFLSFLRSFLNGHSQRKRREPSDISSD